MKKQQYPAMNPLSNVGLGIVFAAGYDAYEFGLTRCAAPGEPGSVGFLSWLAGWDEAHESGLGKPPTAKEGPVLSDPSGAESSRPSG